MEAQPGEGGVARRYRFRSAGPQPGWSLASTHACRSTRPTDQIRHGRSQDGQGRLALRAAQGHLSPRPNLASRGTRDIQDKTRLGMTVAFRRLYRLDHPSSRTKSNPDTPRWDVLAFFHPSSNKCHRPTRSHHQIRGRGDAVRKIQGVLGSNGPRRDASAPAEELSLSAMSSRSQYPERRHSILVIGLAFPARAIR